ncbi:MAG TPA: nucleotidyltransferase family protein [Terriglobia bacterium]|nr:nucleotidyltransferase family protein [Terriglobia bacterium]
MNRALASGIVRALSMNRAPEDSWECLRCVPAAQWRRSLGWFHSSGIALYFWDWAKSHNARGAVPPDVQAVLEDRLAMNRKRLEQMTGEFRAINGVFRESGVRHAVLKGFALIPDYCPNPALRNQYDFDFLISAESMELADRRLRSAGFIPKEGSRCTHPVVYLDQSGRTQPPSDIDSAYSPLTHRSVEIHTRLWEADAEKIAFELPANPLARAGERNWNGIQFYSLSPEDALVFQVLHAFRHVLNNKCRLSIFLEIARFIDSHSADKTFWRNFTRLLAGRMRLSEAAAVVFCMALSLFEPERPPELDALLARFLRPAMALWVSRYGLRLAFENFSSSKESLHLHRLFIENAQVWPTLKRRRLYPAQLPAMPHGAGAGGLRARYRQAIHIARRAYFHSSSALRYWWGLPAWTYAVGRANRSTRGEADAGALRGLAGSRKAVLKFGENDDGLRS